MLDRTSQESAAQPPRAISPFAEKYGPWAVVTGASDGIGRAIAEGLAAEGVSLILAARRQAVLEETANALRAEYNIETDIAAADLGTEEGIAAVETASAARDVGLLVAAAGYGTSGPFIDGTIADERDMIAVNCSAVAALTHTFGRRFAARGRGGIILMSSLLAFQGVPRAANYAATKAYVQTLAEGLAVELRPHGVDVLASAPGPVRSGFLKRAHMTASLAQTPEEVARNTLRTLGRRVTVRPGFLAWALETSLAPLPRRGRTGIMTRVMAGMTAR